MVETRVSSLISLMLDASACLEKQHKNMVPVLCACGIMLPLGPWACCPCLFSNQRDLSCYEGEEAAIRGQLDGPGLLRGQDPEFL